MLPDGSRFVKHVLRMPAMPTLEQLADDYAERIRAASAPRGAIVQLIRELNALVDEHGNALSREEKHEIVDLVAARFGRQKPGTSEYYFPTTRSGDNARYLDVVRALKQLIK